MLLSTTLAIFFLGYKKEIEAQTNTHKLKVVNEKLEERFANVSPKFVSNNGYPLLDFIFTADPATVEYNGRIYVYATNDYQQYEHVGKDGKNTYDHIRTLVMTVFRWYGQLDLSWSYKYCRSVAMESEFMGTFRYIQAGSRW